MARSRSSRKEPTVIFALLVACVLLALMMCLAKAEPTTAKLRVHRKETMERELARMRRDRF